MKKPEVSVIMPVYNAERYIGEAIESILKQSFKDFELIILNDKSTDSSSRIIQSYADTDDRIVFVDKTVNIGPAKLRNEGFDLAKGNFIALMDADDISVPDRFEKQLAVFSKNPEIGVCGSCYTIFGDQTTAKYITHPENHDEIAVMFLKGCYMANPTAMFRKAVLGDSRHIDMIPAEDYHLWCQLIYKTKFYNIQESLLQYRWHTSNISQRTIDNLIRATHNIRLLQLQQYFGITAADPNIESYVNALEFKRGLSAQEVIATLEASQKLIAANRESRTFNLELFEKQLNHIAVRTIRKSKEYNKTLLKYLQNEGKPVFQQIRWFDRILILLKSF